MSRLQNKIEAQVARRGQRPESNWSTFILTSQDILLKSIKTDVKLFFATFYCFYILFHFYSILFLCVILCEKMLWVYIECLHSMVSA